VDGEKVQVNDGGGLGCCRDRGGGVSMCEVTSALTALLVASVVR